MPLYEYDCPRCGRFEALQRLSDSPLRKHDACGAKVRRVMSAGSFAFKGSGFYATDYGRKASGDAKKTAAPACDAPKSEACGSCPSKAEA
ncbi:MAG TPA: FmdB family zinc ribbon protein [Anaeromyxobacteraceae bacterium]|jgi:putative FmdB family regulatory protein